MFEENSHPKVLRFMPSTYKICLKKRVPMCQVYHVARYASESSPQDDVDHVSQRFSTGDPEKKRWDVCWQSSMLV